MTWKMQSQNDGSDGARAVFRTSVEVTGEPAKLPEEALYRMACVYYLGRLEEAALQEAYSSLKGIYTFHRDNAYIAADGINLLEQAAKPERKKIMAFRKQDLKPLEIGE